LSGRERDLGRVGAGALLAGVLREQPRSTVIFSASSVDQIRRIAEGCRT
jgi:hypothetical protein